MLTYLNGVPGEHFKLSQNLMPHYSRLVIILFPNEFNGYFRLKKAKADTDFGVKIEPPANGKGFARLVWADGTPIENGWRPSSPYVIPTDPVPRRPPVKRAVAHAG